MKKVDDETQMANTLEQQLMSMTVRIKLCTVNIALLTYPA